MNQKIKSKSKKCDSNNLSDINIFLEWLNKNGAHMENIRLEYLTEFNRYAVLKKDLKAGEIIASIPQSLIITQEIAEDSIIGRTITKYLENQPNEIKDLTLSGRIYLCSFLIYEKYETKEKSPFCRYLWTLPEEYDDPLWWTEEQIQLELDETNLSYYIKERRDLLKSEYNVIEEACKNTDLFKSSKALTWKNFLWAYSSIYSRGFPSRATKTKHNHDNDNTNDNDNNNNINNKASIKDIIKTKSTEEFSIGNPEVEKCNFCLWPGVDMLNHRRGQRITWKVENGMVHFITDEDLEAGKECFNNYGPKGNEEFLMGYGFCIENNPDDYCRVKVNTGMDPLVDRKSKILVKLDNIFLLHFLHAKDIFVNKKLSNKLLNMVRVLVMNEWELINYEKKINSIEEDKLPEIRKTLIEERISLRNEVVMLTTLKHLLETKENKIVNSRRINEKKYPNIKSNPMATIYREGQLKLLREARILVENKLKTILEDDNIIRIEKILNDETLAEILQKPNVEIEWDEESLFMFYLMINRNDPRFKNLLGEDKTIEKNIIKQYTSDGIDELDEIFQQYFEPNYTQYDSNICKENLYWAATVIDIYSFIVQCHVLGEDIQFFGLFI
ncbi:SET domain-containing protein [Anaeromyces robustus]|uniref:SET domain-containing protein n=1 Tax=Anaeromyces robustus TaxID=1754192 RepID=A0A1Y1VRQ2_9FUNG|nr:SET domain-containing protein [Anaeromyces robustus]|eukprot:ORX63706.1 SET domain-containing protein [Anaeromyces robustus]